MLRTRLLEFADPPDSPVAQDNTNLTCITIVIHE